jgi:hypothetical protein
MLSDEVYLSNRALYVLSAKALFEHLKLLNESVRFSSAIFLLKRLSEGEITTSCDDAKALSKAISVANNKNLYVCSPFIRFAVLFVRRMLLISL